jgi:hypothetical protein
MVERNYTAIRALISLSMPIRHRQRYPDRFPRYQIAYEHCGWRQPALHGVISFRIQGTWSSIIQQRHSYLSPRIYTGVLDTSCNCLWPCSLLLGIVSSIDRSINESKISRREAMAQLSAMVVLRNARAVLVSGIDGEVRSPLESWARRGTSKYRRGIAVDLLGKDESRSIW